MVEMYSELHLTIKKNGVMSFVRKWLQSEVILLKPEKKYISLSCLSTHTHAHIHTHTHKYTYTYIHTQVYIHTCVHTHTEAHIYTYIFRGFIAVTNTKTKTNLERKGFTSPCEF